MRLICYHVLHWSCLNRHCLKYTPGTPPNAYQCPLCSKSIFPLPNNASPVAEKLRNKLESVEWGRHGLSAMVVSEKEEPPPTALPPAMCNEIDAHHKKPNEETIAIRNTVHNSDCNSPLLIGLPESSSTYDADDNKYQSRPTASWIRRMIKLSFPRLTISNPNRFCKQICLIFVVGMLIIFTGGMFFEGISRDEESF